MEYALSIPEANQQAHIDIENDIAQRKNGLFTFIIRVHDGRIEDYILLEYVDAKSKYRGFATIAYEKLVASYSYWERDKTVAIRSADI